MTLFGRGKTITGKIKEIAKTINGFNFLPLTLAGVINAFGVIVFLAPVKLYDSGISGTSMILSQITPDYLSLSFFLLLLNIPLFLYGLKKQGSAFTVYAIYTVSIYSFTAWMITDVLPVDVSIVSPLAGSDLFLCAIFGGLISGAGSGMAVRFGGAMDGIEVLAIIFARKLGLTVGTFVMLYNVALYILCGVLINSWVLPLYSIVTYAAALKTIDFFIEGFDRAKAATIITTHPEKICEALSKEFENGITLVPARGYYSDTPRTMVYFVVNRFQVGKMRSIVQKLDPKAYISMTEVADVFGADD